jgi:hypothetical protein
MIRELITRLNRAVSEKLVAPRRGCNAPMKVWFDPDAPTERAADAARAACIMGEMTDVSKSGVAFLVPFIRVKEKYLVNQERILNIEIDMPAGKVHMRAVGKRYEKVGMHTSVERFYVGAEIVSLTGSSKEIYDHFLKNGPRPATTAERVGMVAE